MIYHIYTLDTGLLLENIPDYVIYHNTKGPASICYDPIDGNILVLTWYVNGILHRKNKPAMLYYRNGHIFFKKYYDKGLLTRDIEPAHVYYTSDGDITQNLWYKDNKLIASTYDVYKKYIYDTKNTNSEIYTCILKKEALHIFDK